MAHMDAAAVLGDAKLVICTLYIERNAQSIRDNVSSSDYSYVDLFIIVYTVRCWTSLPLSFTPRIYLFYRLEIRLAAFGRPSARFSRQYSPV